MDNTSELLAIYRDGLLNDTVPFWTKYGVDQEHGGFMMSLNRDGSIIDTDKGIWQQGRASWLFGELYNQVEQRPEWLKLARHGVDFLDRFGFDPDDGRMWFQVTREGIPIRKRRYAFSESFAAIAYGELARATGAETYAQKAQAAFERFVSHGQDPAGVTSKFTRHRPMSGLGVPMITIVTAQELRESIGLESADTVIEGCIELIQRNFIHEELHCVLETSGPNGEFLDTYEGRTLNPGHAIEGAWFILKEGEIRNDSELVQLGCKMLDLSWERGWDRDFGGMRYFVDVKGLPVQEYWHDMKFWWPQNETIIATLLAYKLTSNRKYLEWHQAIHDWAYSQFPDPEFGEWFGYLHRDGRISSQAKGNLWKGPFHIPRMQLECWKILERF